MISGQMASGGTVIAMRLPDHKQQPMASGKVNELRNHSVDPNQYPDADIDIEARMPLARNDSTAHLKHKNSMRGVDTAGTNNNSGDILRLNIGGSSYRIRCRSIVKFGPMTLLGRFVRMNHEHRRQWADGYFDESNEYFFERVPRYFDPMYDFYATGKLHVPKDLCFDKFMAELRFWAVPKSKMDDCCSPFTQYSIGGINRNQGEEQMPLFIGLRCAKLRRKLWLVLEGRQRTRWWRLFEFFSTTFVILSITALVLGSIPEFQVIGSSPSDINAVQATVPTHKAASGFTVSSTIVQKHGELEDIGPLMVEHPIFTYIENVCVIYFTIEYTVRILVAPRKCAFVKDALNIIDLLAITPFMFEMLLWLVGISGDNVRKVRWAFLTVRLLRVLRVVRIAKLGRFSPGLANFALTLQRSKKQMQMVGIVMMTVVIFFSTLVYFLEKDTVDSKFISIPASAWWCIVTMTTVGYGDQVPQTVAGKLVGSGAIICGVMVLALPITIMVNNFMQVAKLREEKIVQKYEQHGEQI